MRKILLLLLLISGLWSCQDDDTSFGVMMPLEDISFRPTAGGAIMHYKLPQDKDILSIRVRYQDALGQNVLRTGSYACDTLLLVGFNEARQEVKAYVSLCSRDDIESDPVEVTFDTEDSGPVAFFDNLEVKPSWNGFTIMYDVPENAKGMAHVLYIGENPRTKEPDTLLINSFALTAGADTLTFVLKQSYPTYNVVVRTEDFRGYMVKQKTWENVEAYNTAKLDPSHFDCLDPAGLSIEDPDAKLGRKYLFDGDTKGEIWLGTDKYTNNTYLAGPGCLGQPLFVLDFKETRLVAEIRLYAMLYVAGSMPSHDDPYGRIFRGGVLPDMLPCSVTVFASNNKDDDASWKKIGSFEESKYQSFESRWCIRAYGHDGTYYLRTIADVEAADPVYLEISFPPTGEEFRYIKIVVNELFDYEWSSYYGVNPGEYITLHEVEVYTNKD